MIKTSPAQNEDFYDIIDEFVKIYSFSLKLIWGASILAKSVVEFEFDHQRS